MKNSIKFLIFAISIITLTSCNRVAPNHEGVLMVNYGQDRSDFTSVTGNQGILGFGSELFHVAMFEQKGDPSKVTITANRGGTFDVDPTFTYQANRGRGVDIVFNFKHVGMTNREVAMDNIENATLNQLVINAYREEARKYTTDSILSSLNLFERAVEDTLKRQFENKGFTLLTLTSGLTPPGTMIDAINKKNNALIEAQTVENQLETSKMLQQKAAIDAKTNEIISSGLTEKILQQKFIEAIRTSSNRIIITDGRTPIILGHN